MQSNRLNRAIINLESKSFTTTQSIDTSDRHDYRLRLSGRSGLNLQLQSLKSAVQATIAIDRNRNGRIDRRETLAQTTTSSIATLSRPNLRSGVYWIRIAPTGQGNARYQLTLTPTSPPLAMVAARNSSSFASRVLQLTNAFRRQNGLNPLRLNDRLAAAAQRHSQNMATQDFFSHQGLDGSTAQTRGKSAGYAGGIGENIAAGQTTPKAVVQAWIDSAPHRANLLDRRYRDIGVGFFENTSDIGTVNYRYYWAQNFGIPMQ